MAKKDKESSILLVAEEIIKRYNLEEAKKRMNQSYGLALYDNGMMVKILKNFDYVLENWKLFRQSVALKDLELIKTILTKNSDGGLIDTGDVIIDLTKVSVMYPVHRTSDGGELYKEIDELFERDDNINDFMHGDIGLDEEDEDLE